MPPQYGYQSYYTPPKQKPAPGSLATAASGIATPSNPFGLSGANSMRDAQGGYNPTAPVRAAGPPVAKTRNPAPVAPTNAQAQQSAAPPTAPTPGGYDINTDTTLQGINAFTGLSDEQANATALKQRQQQVLAYGDQGLATAVLGAGDPTVQATAQNPTSTVSQINTQYKQNLHALDEQLNQANLGYSGYRITQDQQAANDYGNQLANAAGTVNSNLDTISSNLASTLLTNQQSRNAAANDAANRLAAAALAAQKNQTAPPTGPLNDAGYPANTTPADLGATPSPITSAQVQPPGRQATVTNPGPPSPFAATANSGAPSIPMAPTSTTPVVSALVQALLSGAVPQGYGSAAQRRRQAL